MKQIDKILDLTLIGMYECKNDWTCCNILNVLSGSQSSNYVYKSCGHKDNNVVKAACYGSSSHPSFLFLLVYLHYLLVISFPSQLFYA